MRDLSHVNDPDVASLIRATLAEGATVEQIVAVFGLSVEAATYRKDEIEAVRRRARGQLRPLPASIADYLEEAKRRGRQEP